MSKNLFQIITLIVCGCLSAPSQSKADTTDAGNNFYGLVHWDGKQTTKKGVAILPTNASEWKGQMEYLWTVPSYPYNYGGCHFEDRYFCTFLRIMDGYMLEQKGYIYDDKTGELLDEIHLPQPFDLFDGAYFEPEQMIYAFVRNFTTETYGWAKLNPRTAALEMIQPYTSIMLYGVAVSEDGQAYGISGNGEVYSIDRTTGNTTLLFKHEDLETKTEPKAHTGAAWDEENQRIVFAVCNLEKDGGSRLFSVDPTKKTVELMYKLDGLGTQLAGLYFEQNVQPDAPSVATGLTIDFEPGSLGGDLCFTLPSSSYSGNTLAGDVKYTVKVDGEKVSESQGKAGAQIRVPVTVKDAGWHTFHVQCSNDAGKGRSAKLESFAGFETPLSPSDVSARFYGGKMHISWTPSPETGVKGGPVNTQSITYVIQSNHNEEFITEPGATSYEYALTAPEKFTPWHFTIFARNADGESRTASSNNVPVGALAGDYFQDFSDSASQYEFTTLNANNDNNKWEWTNDGFMTIYYNTDIPMDDYLTLPPVDMTYGDYYVLGFDAGVFNYEEVFEVKLAEDYNMQGMERAETIYGPITLPTKQTRQIEWAHHDVVMSAPDDSRYFLSIHGVSPADRNVFFIDNVSLRHLAGATVPAAATELKATPDNKGKLKITLTGTLPTKDVAGNQITSVDYVKIMRDRKLLATIELNGADTFEYTDENADKGDNTYIVIAGNATGDGLEARCSAFAGFVTPMSPESCELSYTGSNYDEVEFSWSPVTQDLNGTDVTEAVVYDVIRSLDGNIGYSSIAQKATKLSDNFSYLSIPQFVQYGVYAVVDNQESSMIVSPQIPIGPACTLPLSEGFFGEIKIPYGIETDLTDEDSGLYTTYDTDKYQCADEDGGYGVFIGNNSGESTTLSTAWLSIPQDAVEPVASLQFFGEGDAIANLIHLGVSTDLSEGFKLEKTIETGGMGWQKAEISLDQYRGKDIRVAIKFETVGNTYLRFDDFKVYDRMAAGGVDTVPADKFTVLSGKGILCVKGTNGAEVNIHRIDGMKIYHGADDVTLNLKSGIYIVSVGRETVKVSVK